jgi:hypothetical protein
MTMVGDENEGEIIEKIIAMVEATTEDEWEEIIDRLRESVKEKRAQNEDKDDRDCHS